MYFRILYFIHVHDFKILMFREWDFTLIFQRYKYEILDNTWLILLIVLQRKVCDFVVFDQSWTKTRELTSDHCSSGHRRLAMVGGMSHADTTSTQFQDAMSYVASQVDLQSNALFRSSPVHYSHCFQQVSTLSWYQCAWWSTKQIIQPMFNL